MNFKDFILSLVWMSCAFYLALCVWLPEVRIGYYRGTKRKIGTLGYVGMAMFFWCPALAYAGIVLGLLSPRMAWLGFFGVILGFVISFIGWFADAPE